MNKNDMKRNSKMVLSFLSVAQLLPWNGDVRPLKRSRRRMERPPPTLSYEPAFTSLDPEKVMGPPPCLALRRSV